MLCFNGHTEKTYRHVIWTHVTGQHGFFLVIFQGQALHKRPEVLGLQ